MSETWTPQKYTFHLTYLTCAYRLGTILILVALPDGSSILIFFVAATAAKEQLENHVMI